MNYVTESLLFLAVARNTICEALNHAEDQTDVPEIKNYIKNEASDYQIMEILVTGNFPEEKYNLEREHRLWEAFKKQLVRNRSVLAESMDETTIDNLIFEMGPVFEHGLSSAKPILEFHNEMGLIPILSELDARDMKLRAYAAKTKVGTAGLKAKEAAQNSLAAAKQKITALKTAGYAASTPAMTAAIKAKEAAQDKLKDLSLRAYSAKTKVGTAALKGKESTQGFLKKAGEKIKGVVKKAGEAPTWKKVAGGLTAVAAAASIAYGAYQVYKNYLSQAARSCKGKPDKGACMKQFKNKAQKAKIAKLQSGMAACTKSSNPESCKQTLTSKIAKEKAKLSA